MNPILILVIGLVWLGSLIGVGKWQHTAGVTAQKVADQKEFDKINEKLADQKTEAAGILKTENEKNLALMVERDQLKTHLEKTREDNRKATAAARDHYAGLGLRFQPAEGAGRGCSGGGAQGTATDAAGADATAAVELPAALAASVRSIAYDADTLADSYRECYGYAQQVR
jgi:hypothetical protein